MNGTPMQIKSVMGILIHQRVQVKMTIPWPQAGAALRAHILMMVENPILKVPRNRD
jgi:hypothetical protein